MQYKVSHVWIVWLLGDRACGAQCPKDSVYSLVVHGNGGVASIVADIWAVWVGQFVWVSLTPPTQPSICSEASRGGASPHGSVFVQTGTARALLSYLFNQNYGTIKDGTVLSYLKDIT